MARNRSASRDCRSISSKTWMRAGLESSSSSLGWEGVVVPRCSFLWRVPMEEEEHGMVLTLREDVSRGAFLDAL